jgi:undecaprenyl diphosphate synthase
MHVAIIMDGNGRWAARRGQARLMGHKKGADTVRRVIRQAPELGIGVLSLYAFSSDNWKRPSDEVNGLMRLFGHFLDREIEDCVANGVRVSFVGRRDRLPTALLPKMAMAERRTSDLTTLELRIAVDYSSRGELRDLLARGASRAEIEQILGPDVDLLIRTGGEQRLSDFLLWQCAYAELYFTPTAWPDFSREDFRAAVESFHGRQRRFGAVASCKIVMNEPPSLSFEQPAEF